MENWVLVPILSARGERKNCQVQRKSIVSEKKARKKVPKWSSAKWGEVCEKGKKKNNALARGGWSGNKNVSRMPKAQSGEQGGCQRLYRYKAARTVRCSGTLADAAVEL